MTDANWAFIIALFACILALAAFVCWVRDADHKRRVTEDLALANEAADLLHALNNQEDLDQLTAEAADRATRGGYIPPPGYGLPVCMPFPDSIDDEGLPQ